MITRKPLVVQKPSLEQGKKELRDIAEQFANYLSFYRSDRGSKHSKMGPVGKILTRMRTGKRREAMMGEAIRIHEMDAKKNPSLPNEMNIEQYKALESAILGLSEALDRVTAADHSRVIATVDAMVYYFLEKRRKDFFFSMKSKFGQYLQEKYGNVEALSSAWDKEIQEWDDVPYPTKKLETIKNLSIRSDVKEYLEQSHEVVDTVELEEEEVEV